MNIIVFGGDGFCGWPTALHLSALGHRVIIADNLSRRRIDGQLGVQSLTPIASLADRVATWNRIAKPVHALSYQILDLALEPGDVITRLRKQKPEAVIHFAEQRAAPYSMRSTRLKRYTVSNNVNATHSLLSALADCARDTHLIHLGTMGVYGYGTAGSALPEGYVRAMLDNGEPEREIVYPPNPGSVYHMTKVLDAQMFQFYAKNDGLRITDLHQGIVWGTNTEETSRHLDLINRFDYDGDYGTVLNRFLVQATIGHPLTVHGTGGQTRAFIHIRDTVRCIALALDNPPSAGDRPLIFNQMAETHRLIDLAQLIQKKTGCEIANVDNPRKEAERNDLLVTNDNFKRLGWNPILLSEWLLDEVMTIAAKYVDRVDRSKIPATARWVT